VPKFVLVSDPEIASLFGVPPCGWQTVFSPNHHPHPPPQTTPPTTPHPPPPPPPPPPTTHNTPPHHPPPRVDLADADSCLRSPFFFFFFLTSGALFEAKSALSLRWARLSLSDAVPPRPPFDNGLVANSLPRCPSRVFFSRKAIFFFFQFDCPQRPSRIPLDGFCPSGVFRIHCFRTRPPNSVSWKTPGLLLRRTPFSGPPGLFPTCPSLITSSDFLP